MFGAEGKDEIASLGSDKFIALIREVEEMHQHGIITLLFSRYLFFVPCSRFQGKIYTYIYIYLVLVSPSYVER